MGWLNGNSKSKSKPSGSSGRRKAVTSTARSRNCHTCGNTGRIPNVGIAPGGGLVILPGSRPCPGNH